MCSTPGSYCETPGLINVTGPCAGGFYCSGGANTSSPMDGGTTGWSYVFSQSFKADIMEAENQISLELHGTI